MMTQGLLVLGALWVAPDTTPPNVVPSLGGGEGLSPSITLAARALTDVEG